MMDKTSKLIVFSDLDGTLLNHHDYRFDAALPALERLHRNNVPLILSSSKTAEEIGVFRRLTGFESCPAIVENGGGILQPFTSVIEPGSSYKKLLDLVYQQPEANAGYFSGFSKWPAEKLMELTGLSEVLVKLAMERHYSEPGLWLGNAADKQAFLNRLQGLGVQAHQGGRFLTLALNTSKGERMLEIRKRYQEDYGKAVTSIALGDSPNDIEMLQQADIAVIIPNPDQDAGKALNINTNGRLIRAETPGASGWGYVMQNLLDEFMIK